METEKKPGRKTLPKGEKKERVIAFVPEKMVKALGYDNCKLIAENSIITAYEAKLHKGNSKKGR